MRFPRNARIFRGQLDAAPFAGVFFLILIFLALNSQLVFTPGVRIELPAGDRLPGVANQTALVALDSNGHLYHENQIITEPALRTKLTAAVARATAAGISPTLTVLADKAVPNEMLVRLAELARQCGFGEVLQVTRPRIAPVAPPAPKP